MTLISLVRPAVIAGFTGVMRRAAIRSIRNTSPCRDLTSVVVVGALAKRNGIAQGAHLQAAALRRNGHDVQMLDATAALRNPFHHEAHRRGSIYVLHTGVPETSRLVHGVLPEASAAWRVGYWAWELPQPPPQWRKYADLVSEIWVPSTYVATAMRGLFQIPVHVVPHPVQLQEPRRRDPEQPFTVLVMADSRSSFIRKNVAGSVAAFRRAFGTSTSARLIVKLNGNSLDASPVAVDLAGVPNVQVITSYLGADAMSQLYGRVDVLLSLHRAEGFGLPLREAMAHGLPVVCTGWSGNMDFTTVDNSLLVPYTMVPVQDASGIYVGGHWAEPDIDVAVDMLRTLADDDGQYARLAASAHRSVATSGTLTLPGHGVPV